MLAAGSAAVGHRFALLGEGAADERRQTRARGMPGARPSAAACAVDPRQDAILIGRARVADAGARGGDRRGGDAALIERRQPRHAGFVDADPGIVEERRQRIVFERGLRPAAEQSAMRAGDDDRADDARAPTSEAESSAQTGGGSAISRNAPSSAGGGAARAGGGLRKARRRRRGRTCRRGSRAPSASGFAWVTTPRAIMSAPSPMRAVSCGRPRRPACRAAAR